MNPTNDQVKQAAKRTLEQYHQTFKDLAKYDSDYEPLIETHTTESPYTSHLMLIALIVIPVGFIIGALIMNNL